MQQGLAKLTRDQYLVLGSLVGTTLLAWLYLVQMAWRMPGMDMRDAMMVSHPQGTFTQFALTALMWAVMMVGMMLPSAMPMVLLFATVQRRHAARPGLPIAAFVAGYFLVWGTFSVVAAALQTLLSSTMLLAPTMSLTSGWIGGLLFLAAGAYEFSPLKRRCLDHCRSPLAFVMAHWRPGLSGAVRMGIEHGAFCLGCCWVLMLLLFVGGVMNLAWVAALTALVLVQKIAPGGAMLSRVTGGVLLAIGLVLLGRAGALIA